jgi:hypothetical protein
MEKNYELSIISSRGENFQPYCHIFYSEAFFYFSLTMLCLAFSTSCESVLPIWSTTAQRSRLSNPSTRAADLFVLLHGMLISSSTISLAHLHASSRDLRWKAKVLRSVSGL